MHFCISSNHYKKSLSKTLTFGEQPFGVSNINISILHMSKLKLRELT